MKAKKIHKTELRLPMPLAKKIKKIASDSGISFNQFIRFAAEEKLKTEELQAKA